MNLPKEEYREAVGCLKRYNYNCVNILNIRADIMSINIPTYNGMPKTPYHISDSVYHQYLQLEENEELQKSLKEYKAVMLALELMDEDSKYIFEKEFRADKNKWEIIEHLQISEETYKRRKKKLIYTVYEKLKSLT